MNISSVDGALLQVLEALLLERNVSRAAVRLHLSQPAVSAALRRLRELFDDPLFVRHARGVVPTARALALAEPTREVLAKLRALLAPTEDFVAEESNRIFRVAATDYTTLTIAGKLVRRLQKEAPHARLTFMQVHLDRLERDLENGTIDAAVLGKGRAGRALNSNDLVVDDYVVAFRRRHRWSTKRSVSARELVTEPHVFVSPVHGSFVGVLDARLAEMNLARSVVLSVNSFAAAMDAIVGGGLIGIVPKRVALAHRDRVDARPVPLALTPLTMQWVTHPRSRGDLGLSWLHAHVEATFA